LRMVHGTGEGEDKGARCTGHGAEPMGQRMVVKQAKVKKT